MLSSFLFIRIELCVAVENYIVNGNDNISSRVKFIHDVQVGVFALDQKL